MPIKWTHTTSNFLSVKRMALPGANAAAQQDMEDWNWSGCFDISSLGQTAICVRHADRRKAEWNVKVEVRILGPTVFVVLDEFHEVADRWALPFRVDNSCIRQTVHSQLSPVSTTATANLFSFLAFFPSYSFCTHD